MRWRLVSAAVAVGVTAAACRAPAQPPAPPPPTLAPEVQRSRELLGEPLVALAEAAAVLASDVDTVRHEVGRGRDMRAGLDDVMRDVRALRRAASDVLGASRLAPVPEAATVAKEAVNDALAAAEEARREAAYLRHIAAIDIALLDVAAAWDQPGSQSEQRARLAQQVEVVRGIAGDVAEVEPVPARCRQLTQNRERWANVVERRTANLQDQANSFAGERYDQLRDSYRAQPFGEDSVAADAKDRGCWVGASDVFATAEDLRGRVEQVEQILSVRGSHRA